MNKKYLYLSLLSIGLVACGETPDTEHETPDQLNDTTQITEIVEEVIEEEVEAVIDFSKFDHYATILTKSDLITQFGQDNLVDKVSWYAEGTVERQSTLLTNPENGHVVKYIWSGEDDETTSWIEANYYLWDEDFGIDGNQSMETVNGLKLGMSLAELRTWNQADFEFSGFGWDFGGGVFEKEGTNLGESNVQVTLINDQVKSNEGFEFMIGDVGLHADDENLKDAPVLVEQLSLFIGEE